GIVLVALGLLASFVAKLREKANRMLCASNLRQIGIAAHNYQNDFMKLPAGYYGPLRANGDSTNVKIGEGLDRGPWAGCLVKMIPYMESDNLYSLLWATEQCYPPTMEGG